jgi:LL-H family phage holin
VRQKERTIIMNDILFEALKIMVMLVALLVTRYLVPWLINKIGADKLELAEKWAKYAVLKAQQVMYEENGQERKAYVTEFLKEILLDKDIALSDEQIDVLIESAVKTMKIEESKKEV